MMEADRDLKSRDDADAPVAATTKTLGQALAGMAHRIAARRVPALGWLAPLQAVAERVTALSAPTSERFRRIPVQDWPSPRHAVEAPQAPPRDEETVVPLSAIRATPWEGRDGEPVTPALRERLRHIVGPGSESLRLHADDRGANVAASARSEALTIGRHVFLGRNRGRSSDELFALLTHETEHVLAGMRPGAAWKRATQAGAAEEERAALGRERAARRYLRGDPPGAAPAMAIDLAAAPPARLSTRSQPLPAMTSAGLRPMAASPDRNSSDSAPPSSAPSEVEAIKRAVHRDMMSRMRSDFERGG
jgi:hypothetical protein